MTTKEIIENCRKNKGYTYKITHISAAKCPFSVALYANDLFIFLNSLMKTLVILEKSQINRDYINKFTYISAD